MLRRLDVNAFGLSLGFSASIATFILGFISSFGYALPLIDFISSFFIGFSPTISGSVVGSAWAFFYFYIFGALIAWLYNRLS